MSTQRARKDAATAATPRSALDATMWPAPLVADGVDEEEVEEVEADEDMDWVLVAVAEASVEAADEEELVAALLVAAMTAAMSWGILIGLPLADMSTLPVEEMVSGFMANMVRA